MKKAFRNIALDSQKSRRVAEILKAVAHPLRIQIVAFLCKEKEAHVNGLSETLKTSQAIVSQQLKILRLRGLVEVSRKNGFAYYRLAEPHLKELVCCMEKCDR